METQPERPAEEIRRLRRCINDLVSVLALPAVWSGGDPTQIVRTVLDVLLGMLRLDLVYVRLKDLLRETPIEMVRVAPSTGYRPLVRRRSANCSAEGLDPTQRDGLERHRIPSATETFRSCRCNWGFRMRIGVIVAGSQRADFPGQTERLLLSVAANQVAMGLQEARR